jgi:hypothetical protein
MTPKRPKRQPKIAKKKMRFRWEILLSALLIAAIVISHRYEIAVFALPPDYVGLWRTANWTEKLSSVTRSFWRSVRDSAHDEALIQFLTANHHAPN